MSYTLGIPADGQSLGNSKPQVRGNFTTIYNAFAVNHVAFNSFPQGAHTRVDLTELGTDPIPPVQLDTLYTKVTGTVPTPGELGELFYVRGGGALPHPSNQPIQMTNGITVNASEGITFLPGGIIMQWGIATLNSSGNKNVTFAKGFYLLGVQTPPWSIQLTLISADSLIKNAFVETYAFDQFRIRSFGAASYNVFWLAIGPST